MSVTLKQVTQRSAGGDIVRTHSLPTAEPVIGRGTECDIQLPDLAVSLRHAILRQTRPGFVSIEALKGFTFDVGGQSVTKTELQLSENTRANFGSHILEFSSGQEKDEVVVTVTRLAGDRDAGIDARRSVFSLQSSIFGRRRMAYLATALILFFCLAAPVVGFYLDASQARMDPDRQWSSGALSIGHAFLEDDCQACHQQAFVAVRDENCLTCHRAELDEAALTRLSADMRSAGSLFAPRPAVDHAPNELLMRSKPVDGELGAQLTAFVRRVFDHPSDRCSNCHIEHVGYARDEPAPLTAPAPIHIEDIAMSDCTLCHGAIEERLADTQLRDVANWEQHPEFNATITLAIENDQAQTARLDLAQMPAEYSGLSFPHDVHNSATGGVARMAIELGEENGYSEPLDCASCHHPNEEFRGFQPIEMERDCAACHSLAFASNGDDIRYLPHGDTEEVTEMVQEFYAGLSFDQLRTSLSRRPPGNEMFGWTTGLVDGPLPASANDMTELVFAEGGPCYGCHAIDENLEQGLPAYHVASIQLSERYLPFGGFDHGVPEHHEDETGNAICLECHNADTSESSADVMLPGISACRDCHGPASSPNLTATSAGFMPEHPVSTMASAECTQCHGYHTPGAPVVSFREKN